MAVPPAVDPHTKAMATLLATAGFPVGDAEADFNIDPPFLILFLISSPPPTGDLTNYQSIVTFRYQVTAIGTTQEQAQMLLDKARAVMERDDLSISGRRVMMLQLDFTRGDIREERGVPEPVFSAVDQYLLMTTPG